MTKIEWTEQTWNPIVGCTIVSAGCSNCYAMRQANRLLDKPGSHYDGTTRVVNGNPVWTGKVALAPDHILTAPLRRRKPTHYFVNSMGDLFHEDVPDEWIDKTFAVMALCPQHTFQVLTKRPKRMREYLKRDSVDCAGKPMDDPGMGTRDAIRHEMVVLGLYKGLPSWPLPNVWLGTSCEDQTRAEERIPDLLETPAAVRFVSAEPLLGPVDLNGVGRPWLTKEIDHPLDTALDWIIVGGESGPGARPMELDWARAIIEQCRSAGVPVFVKQLGAHVRCNDLDAGHFKHVVADDLARRGCWLVKLRDRKGGDPSEWPADLRVRQFPNSNKRK